MFALHTVCVFLSCGVCLVANHFSFDWLEHPKSSKVIAFNLGGNYLILCELSIFDFGAVEKKSCRRNPVETHNSVDINRYESQYNILMIANSMNWHVV